MSVVECKYCDDKKEFKIKDDLLNFKYKCVCDISDIVLNIINIDMSNWYERYYIENVLKRLRN